MTGDQDVAGIVEALSAAQKNALCEARDNTLPFSTSATKRVSMPTLRALAKLGCSQFSSGRLTPLGILVRERLMAEGR